MSGKQRYVDRGWLGPLYTAILIGLSVEGFYEFRVHTATYDLDERLNGVIDVSHGVRCLS